MKKILAIDDNKDILFALSEIFKYKNWESVTASSVETGLKLFKENDIDLIIIDYHMPGINGLEGVKLLRQLSSKVPIIVLTVEESQDVADQFLDAGASDFALKPFKAPDLLARLMVHLRSEANRAGKTSESGFKEYTKGISLSTLEIIEEKMSKTGLKMTLGEIAEETGLAYQTVHRYINHLVEHGVVTSKQSYGKIGRPKQSFSWTI